MTFNGEISGCNPLEMKSLVQQEMIKRGVYGEDFTTCVSSHTDEDIEYTLKAYKEVLRS